MSLILGRDEKIVREENNVTYHAGYSRVGHPMFGRLLLSNKRFAYVEQKMVERGGFLAKRKELETVGIKINLPVDKVIGAATETRQRKKGTVNEPPSLFSKEPYNLLIVSLETDMGVENPSFEVGNANDWARAIQSVTGGERL